MPDASSEESQHSGMAALREPHVGVFTVGRALSNMAMQIVSVAVGWELYERTGDALSLGLVGVAQVAPALLLTLPAGHVTDKFPRRNVAMIGACFLALGAIGLAVVSFLKAPIGLVYLFLVIGGAGRAFSVPSVNSMLAHLLKPELLSYGYAWLVSSSQLANMTGPAAGGFLIAFSGGAAPTYLVAAGAQIIFIGLLSTLPPAEPPPGTSRPGFKDLFGGIGFITSSPIFLSAITLDLFAVLFGAAVALLPVFAKDVLEVGPSGLGLLRSSPAVGAVLTALLVTHLPPWKHPGRVMLITVTIFGLATTGFGLSHNLYLSMAFLFLAGCVDSISVVIRGTIQQVSTPNRLRGRVAAINSLFISLSNEMGAFRSGAMASLLGAVPAVVIGGICTVLVVPVVAFVWRPMLDVGPLHTLRPLEEEEKERAPA